MGLLDQLWDETLAGPMPDNGLSKLRKKHSTFSFRPNFSKGAPDPLTSLELDQTSRSFGEEATDDAMRVTRSIMIVKPSHKDSPPVSPAASTPPLSPFSGGGREAYRFRRRSGSFAYEKASENGPPRIPSPPYDL